MPRADIEMLEAGPTTTDLRIVRWDSALIPRTEKAKGKGVAYQTLTVKVPQWVCDYAQRLESGIRFFNNEFAAQVNDVAVLKRDFPQLVSAYEGILQQQQSLYDTAATDLKSLQYAQ